MPEPDDTPRSTFLSEFKEFAARGNVIDMAVGIAVGAAFATIASSLVEDVLMPPISLLLGPADFAGMYAILKDPTGGAPYLGVEAAREAGATVLYYGRFIESVFTFFVVALAIFMLVRVVNRIKRQREAEVEPTPASPRDRECPFCAMTIPRRATRCPECTSHLDATDASAGAAAADRPVAR